MTNVIHIKDTPRQYKSDPDYVYIGRGSKWGNPYCIKGAHPEYPWIPMSRNQVCDLYKEYLVLKPELMAALHELKGKTLVCFCKPKACHGDILAEFAERT